MANLARISVGLALAGSLSACGLSAVENTYISSFDPNTVNYIAARGPVYTQIIGNPYEGDQAELERSVTGAMRGANAGQPLSFSTQKDPGNASPYKVVVVFNAATGLGPQELCGETPDGAVKKADGAVRIVAVLCAGDSRETSVVARLNPSAADPRDPELTGIMRQMTRALFPSKNDNILGDSREFDT